MIKSYLWKVWSQTNAALMNTRNLYGIYSLSLYSAISWIFAAALKTNMVQVGHQEQKITFSCELYWRWKYQCIILLFLVSNLATEDLEYSAQVVGSNFIVFYSVFLELDSLRLLLTASNNEDSFKILYRNLNFGWSIALK